MKKRTQINEIKKYLIKKKKISSLEAIHKFGATRLSDIIFKLRNKGWIIETEKVVGRNRYGNVSNYAIYHLIKSAE